MKYRLKLRCQACATKYNRTVEVPEGKSIADIPDPPCPHCSKVQKVKKANWSDGRAPGIGGSVMGKAIDLTAEIAMKNTGLSDLHDSNLRPGDSMAPKLPPRLQAQADAYFGGPKRGQATAGINTRAIAAAAMRGAYTPGQPNPVEIQHRQRVKPPVEIIASTDRKSG